MKGKILRPLLLTCALIPAMAQAFGDHDTWRRGWGQGVSEFVIKGPGQSQLSLTCDDSGTAPATIQFTDATGHDVSMDNEKMLQVRIDGGEAIDISESDSRVGENNFTLAWNALRTGKQVTVSGDGIRSATFTLNGAGKVLPAFGTHGCVSRASL